MKEKLTQLLQEGQEKIRAARSEGELQEVKGLLLGKQGALTGLLKELPRLDVSLRPEMGKAVNQAKAQLTELLESKREELKLKASEVDPDFDITVPGTAPLSGGLHPITQMCYDLNDAFRSMGFEIFEESDITSELYGFDNLNFPPQPPRPGEHGHLLAGGPRQGPVLGKAVPAAPSDRRLRPLYADPQAPLPLRVSRPGIPQ